MGGFLFRTSIKKVMKTRLFLLMMLLTGATATSGQNPGSAYYWVVESNKNSPDHSLVKIYDQRNELVHEVKLDTRLDVTNRKTRRTLSQIIKRYSAREAAAGKKTRSRTSV